MDFHLVSFGDVVGEIVPIPLMETERVGSLGNDGVIGSWFGIPVSSHSG